MTRRRITVSLHELEQDCQGCGHQNGVHTGGAPNWGWPIFHPVWANATGTCNQPVDGSVCGCTRRTRLGDGP
jgi:hypothetical protein